MKNQKELPQLVAQSSTFKLVVPEKVEEKIRYLIRKFPQTEWSGVLFYKHQGTFEDKDLVIICEDIFPMDLGTSGWTEFKMNEDVTAYMAENIELFDCDMGLVHSHHMMGAFFSGQDNLMLQQEGNDTNCFVSLVVDTRGQYVARITRKVQTKSEVTVKSLGTFYKFFGEGTKNITKDGNEVTKVIDKEVIEYFDLEVERHQVPNTLGYLDERFNVIQSRKKVAKPDAIKKEIDSHWPLFKDNMDDLPKDTFFEKPKTETFSAKNDVDDAFDWTPDPKKIHRAVVNMVTCSFIISTEKFDLRQWITRHLDKVYKGLFGDCITMGESDTFIEWKDFIVQYTMDHYDEETPLKDIDIELYLSRIAQAMCDELHEFSTNYYINVYMEALYYYVIE